jgi:hypothetical protein
VRALMHPLLDLALKDPKSTRALSDAIRRSISTGQPAKVTLGGKVWTLRRTPVPAS